MIDDKDNKFLSTNVKGMLQDTLDWMNERNTKLLDQGGVVGTPAEIKLFASLRGRQRSISDLARVIGISRQAVHNTVHKLIDKGLVELIPAPDNDRDKLVAVTQLGQETRKVAAKNLRQIEAEFESRIGKRKLEQLRAILLKHQQILEDSK